MSYPVPIYSIGEFNSDLLSQSISKEKENSIKERNERKENEKKKVIWTSFDKIDSSSRQIKITLSDRSLKNKELDVEPTIEPSTESLNIQNTEQQIFKQQSLPLTNPFLTEKPSQQTYVPYSLPPIKSLIALLIEKSNQQESLLNESVIISKDLNEPSFKTLNKQTEIETVQPFVNTYITQSENSDDSLVELSFKSSVDQQFLEEMVHLNLSSSSSSSDNEIDKESNIKKKYQSKFNNATETILKAAKYFKEVVIPALISNLDIDIETKLLYLTNTKKLTLHDINSFKSFEEMTEKQLVKLVRNKILKPTFISISGDSALHYFLKYKVRNYSEDEILVQISLLIHLKILNHRNIMGETPLITLLKYNNNWKGCYYVVLCLLRYNPDINLVDNSTLEEYDHEGISAIDYSIIYDYKFKRKTTEYILLLSYSYGKSLISVHNYTIFKYLGGNDSIKLHYTIKLINQTIKLFSKFKLQRFIPILIYNDCINTNPGYSALGNVEKVIDKFELFYNLERDKWDSLYDNGSYRIDNLKYFPNSSECGLSSLKIKLLSKVAQISPDLIVFINEKICSNSNVYRGLYRGVNVALKTIKTDPSSCADTYKELNACVMLIDSTKIVKFHGVVKLEDQFYIVMDLCKQSLYKELLEIGKSLTMKQALSYCRQVLCFQYVHRRNIIHRDLKSLNVLVIGSNKLVLCDFGVSGKLNDTNEKTYDQYKGTLCYSSPESFNLIEIERNQLVRGNSNFKAQIENIGILQRKKCDVYSCAIVLWEIMTTFTTGSYKQPFNNFTLVTQGYIQKIPISYPVELKNLIESALQFHPKHRPSIDEFLLEFSRIEEIYQSNVDEWENLTKDTQFEPDLVYFKK